MGFQITWDCADSSRMTRFWSQALGYRVEDPPRGVATWNDYWNSVGVPAEELDPLGDGSDSLVDPSGRGPRIWFQQVPEAKSVKNRLHLDINAGGGRAVDLGERKARVHARAEELIPPAGEGSQPGTAATTGHGDLLLRPQSGNTATTGHGDLLLRAQPVSKCGMSDMTSTAATAKSRRRAVLVPLASLLAAGALAVGSGATFTSTSQNAGSSYTTGTLAQSNSRANAAIFMLDNLKPGDTLTGTVTIKNTGSLPATFKLTESAATTQFGSLLTMVVAEGAAPPVYTGTFGGLATKALGTAAWTAGETHTYTFAVTLAASAGDEFQGKVAGATYTWDSVQTAGETKSTPTT